MDKVTQLGRPGSNLHLGPSELEAHWLPYTGNREFKKNPRIVVGAEGAYFTDSEGRRVFDGLSGLWCCGLGHGRKELAEAVGRQMAALDYSPAFNCGHPLAFELANKISSLTPEGLDYVFFTNSGSEAADTALKMARAYWRLKGQPAKTHFIGRRKGYHGVNFGGTSVGGIGANRKLYGQVLPADHLKHTMIPDNAFSRGVPAKGAELADELLEQIALHDASNIAAVIIEPFAGSGGVIVPPRGYLERIREICNEHQILLIFDEVITGFGRTGHMFGCQAFAVTPDIINVAKQLSNGTQPIGAVIAKADIYQVFMAGGGPPYMIEFPHGYTYSAHPVACAAALAALHVLESDGLVERVRDLSPYFEDAVHSLAGAKYVLDIRNYGLAAGMTFESLPGEPARRPFEVAMKCWKKGFYVRCGGDTIQLAPPFIAERQEIDSLINALGEAINELD